MEKRQKQDLRSGWTGLQHDVIQQICSHLEGADFWTARYVSKAWASASKQAAGHEFVIPATAPEVGTKIRELFHWRQAGMFRNCNFMFLLEQPMVLELLCITLIHIDIQGSMLTKCSLNVTLLLDPIMTPDYKATAQLTAKIASQLGSDHQLTLRLMVDAAAVANNPPAPEVVALLGQYLYHFDTWNIPTQQPAAGEPVDFDTEAALSAQHIRALTGSKASVATICVSGYLHAVEDDPFAAFETLGLLGIPEIGVTAALASMTNLTTLHLSTIDQREAIDYQPLAKLSLLRDLALQCCAHKPCCCEGVLHSNRHTLLDVTLTASTWSAATYYSLQRVEQLENLNISIRCLDAAQAQAMSTITAGHFRLALHPYVNNLLSALNGSKPAIHALTIWAVFTFGHHSLPELPTLQCLTLVDCDLTGKDLRFFPLVTQLTLVDCPHITGQGLQHIVRSALPALEAISFQVTPRAVSDPLKLSVQALNALHFGEKLHSIDLRGVGGLTYKRVSDLSGVLRRKQCRSKVPPSVTLSLPFLHSGEGVPVVDTIQHMFVPNIFALPDSNEHYNMYITENG